MNLLSNCFVSISAFLVLYVFVHLLCRGRGKRGKEGAAIIFKQPSPILNSY